MVVILLAGSLGCRDITDIRGPLGVKHTGTQQHSSSHHLNSIHVNYNTANEENPQGLLAGGLMIVGNERSS